MVGRINLRVTDDEIEELLKNAKIDVQTVFNTTTVVSMRLETGFVITETASCMYEEDYNEEIGIEICIEKIKSKLFMLQGYESCACKQTLERFL